MTIIATNTVRPHQGKAKLQLNNMLEVANAFWMDDSTSLSLKFTRALKKGAS